jgi:putative DNA primase/helicase
MGGTQVPDFAAVARAALAHADALVARWLPGGRREGDEYVVRNPKRADRTPGSFKVNTRTGAWADFATGEAGGDLVALRAWLDGASQIEAARVLAGELGLGDTAPKVNGHHPPAAPDESWEPILPVPHGAPAPPAAHPRLGRPVHVAEYRDDAGRLLGVVHRYEPAGERKQILPLVLCADGTRLSWRWRGLPKPRPLYGLDLLAARPDASVVVVEGEPKCDAGRRLIGARAVVVTWPGGAKALRHVDWSPLAGRAVAIWPDADEPGIEAARWIADELRRVGARKVGIVNPPADVPVGWDLADAEREGWPAERVLARIRDGTKEPLALRLRRDDPAPPDGDEDRGDAPTEDAPFLALGHDRGRFIFWSRGARQTVELTARELERSACLLQLAPLSWWEREYPMRRGGLDVRAAANDLVQASYRVGLFDPARLRGRGVWIDDGRVVVHLGDRLVVDGASVSIAALRSRFLYEQGLPLPLPEAPPLADAEAARLVDACLAVAWENRDAMGRLLAGWLAIAPVCGALPWRPHLWLSSEAGAGKTWVLDNIVKPVLGPVALKVQSKSTEAGIRAALGLDARPVLFDEAETQNQRDRERMQQVLDLARQASAEHGADILKGTQTGGVRRYRVSSCFCFAAVNVAVEQAADEGRAVVLTILPPTDPAEREEQFARLRGAVRELVGPDFGPRLFARAVRLLPATRANGSTFADAIARAGCSRRTADTLGMIAAGLWSLIDGREVRAAQAEALVAQWGWLPQALAEQETEPEWRRVLGFLLQLPVALPREANRPDQVTVAEAIRAVLGEEDIGRTRTEIEAALKRLGVRVLGGMVWFARGSSAIARACDRTPWGPSWVRTLARAPGAEKPAHVMWFAGAHRIVGVPVPIAFDGEARPSSRMHGNIGTNK